MNTIFKRKDGIKFSTIVEPTITEGYFDYFEDDWMDDKFAFKGSIYFIPLAEGRTKEQQEKGQREMNKIYSKPLYRLREYLLKKWERPKTKEEYIRKNIEFKLYNKILDKISKIPESDEESNKTLEYSTGTISDVRAYKSDKRQEQIGAQVDEKTKMPYLLTSLRIENYLNGFIFDDRIPNIYPKLLNFAYFHEYGHIFEYLKEMIEKGSAKLIDTINEKDRDKAADSEGRANKYAIKNMYRKDRREMLKNAQIDKTPSPYVKDYVKGNLKYNNYFNY